MFYLYPTTLGPGISQLQGELFPFRGYPELQYHSGTTQPPSLAGFRNALATIAVPLTDLELVLNQ